MRLRVILPLLAAAAAVAALIWVPAAGAAESDTDGYDISFTIKLTQDQYAERDSNGDGEYPTLGDSFVFSDFILNEAGEQVGKDAEVCDFVRVGELPDSTVSCSAIFDFNESHEFGTGQIVTHSLVNQLDVPNFELPIVGGTGDFEGAYGWAHMYVIDEITEADVTFYINLPED